MKNIRTNRPIFNTLLTVILLVLLFVMHKNNAIEFSGSFGMHLSTGFFGIMLTMLTMNGLTGKQHFEEEKTILLDFSVLFVSLSFVLSCVMWLMDGNTVNAVFLLIQLLQYILITGSFSFFFAYLLSVTGKKIDKKFIVSEALFYLILVSLVLSKQVYSLDTDGFIVIGKMVFLPSLIHLVHCLLFAVLNRDLCRKFYNDFLSLALLLIASIAVAFLLKRMDCCCFFIALAQMSFMLNPALKRKEEDFYLDEKLLDDLCKENSENEKKARDLLKEGKENTEAVVLYCRFRELKTAKEEDRIRYIPLFNDYALQMAKIIKESGGILLGVRENALVASFVTTESNHNYPFMAVKAALKLKHRVNVIDEENIINGIPELHVGISVALISNIDRDSDTDNFGYPVIGKTLDLAKEIEAIAFDDEVLITEKIKEICGGRITTGQIRKTKFDDSENNFYFYPVEEGESLI